MKVRIPKMGGGMGNLKQLAEQAQKMQEEIDNAKKELEKKEYAATSGGGAVTVKVKGNMEVSFMDIKPEVVDPNDIDMLSDLIIAAMNEALRAATEDQEKTISGISSDIKIPGM